MCVKIERQQEDHVSDQIDENFWSEVLSADNSSMASDFQSQKHYFPSSPLAASLDLELVNDVYGSNLYNTDFNMDFWYNLFTRAGDLPELPEFWVVV